MITTIATQHYIILQDLIKQISKVEKHIMIVGTAIIITGVIFLSLFL
jgi:hypothetical protein